MLEAKKTQDVMFSNAFVRQTRMFKAFLEMQGSGNPLTKKEVLAMVEKRPAHFGALLAYAKRM